MRIKAAVKASGVLSAALLALLSINSYGQDAPMRFRVAEVKVRTGQSADFEAINKILNEAYKKSGVSWREVWSTSMFGEGGVYYGVSEIKSLAQFDQDGPLTKLSVEDRLAYSNLARNAVESARYKLIEYKPELSLMSDRKEPPVYARLTTIQAQAGKSPELEALIKELLLPAIRAAGVKDFWVYYTQLGGAIGEYTYLLLFDKFADLEKVTSTQQLLGDNYPKYMARVATAIAHGKNEVIKLDPKLSYFPEK